MGSEIRQRICSEHIAGGYLYLEAGQLVKRNGPDVFHRFRADSDFVYATGCHDQPGAAALLDTETASLTLMVEKQPDHAAFWMGPQPSPDELAERFGADRVCYTSDLGAVLREQARGQDIHVTNAAAKETIQAALTGRSSASGGASGSDRGDSQGDNDNNGVQSNEIRNGRIIDEFLPRVLQRCRSHKTDAELGCMLAASKVSREGHLAAWLASKRNPGSHEFFLEGAFTGAVLSAGANDLGYPCIVGAGPNAAILHYETNRSQVRTGDLVLIDAGAEVR
ncbi:Creatinase/Aminopeptidase P [Dunaliella salina]|uniref:Creatinase/Aminopeptidase P n=1 Tax=Dunaliella salina TaxID=3046 RepID=A0ABQ7GA69_DUNSA|nr:Creatinase/Aminopeptidase P [Dunaliella salina]|eukprot:KAF5831496.1 Creatinase/Aminopeptidase P [Dunaliella salina]